MSLQTELETSASVPYIKFALFYILYSEGFYKRVYSYIICLIYSTFYS